MGPSPAVRGSMARGRRDPKREQLWRDVLRRHRGSGLRVRAFCGGERLAETAFHAWRRVLDERRPAPVPPVPPAPAFVPMTVLGEGRPGPAGAEIVIELR